MVVLVVIDLARRLGETKRQVTELGVLRREVAELRADLERSLAVTRTHLALGA